MQNFQWNFDISTKEKMNHEDLVKFLMGQLRQGYEFTCSNPYVNNHGTSTYQKREGKFRAVHSDGNSSFWSESILSETALKTDLMQIPPEDLRAGRIYYD